jgi:lipoprotein NlpI
MQLLSEIGVQVLLAVGVFPLVYKVFTTFEDNMSDEARKRFADTIQNINLKGSTGGASVRDIYEAVFSPRHFSLRCAGAVLVVSTICYLLVTLADSDARANLLAGPVRYLTDVMLLRILVNFVADFIALGATRLFVERIGVASGPKKIVLFIMDAGIKFVMVWPTVYLLVHRGSPADFIDKIYNTEPEVFLIIFTPLFLSSLWIWIYAGYLNLLPQLSWLLDFKTHALRSIGFVTAATSSALTFFILVMSAVVSPSAGSLERETARSQNFEKCMNPENAVSLDLQIKACTDLIQSDKETTYYLAVAFNQRGVAYQRKGDLDRSIADHTKAIELDSESPVGYFYRGSGYLEKGDYDRAIADQTRALKLKIREVDGAFFDESRSYRTRGVAYFEKGDYDTAIADLNKAISLNSQVADFYIFRGMAYQNKADLRRAIADYTKSIELDPKNSLNYVNRGVANLYAGSLPKALADLNQASELDRKSAYVALWLDIVEKRSRLAGRLQQSFSQIDMTTWPAPVIRLFIGQLTPEAVLVAADDPDPIKKKDKICEANFYSGAMALHQGKRAEAVRLFRLAAADCPRSSVEWFAANAELRALGATR